jgi:predicted Zn finger-like uncharacterized protein
MRVACPSCSAAYEVPDQMLGPTQRLLRCARCGTEWPVAATIAKPPARPAPESEPESDAQSEPGPGADQRPGPEPKSGPEPEPPAAPAAPRPPPALTIQAAPGRPERMLRPPLPQAEWTGPGPGAQPRRQSRKQAGIGAWFAWLGSIALLALLVWAAYAYRSQVMRIWPPSQRLYVILDLGPTAATPPR